MAHSIDNNNGEVVLFQASTYEAFIQSSSRGVAEFANEHKDFLDELSVQCRPSQAEIDEEMKCLRGKSFDDLTKVKIEELSDSSPAEKTAFNIKRYTLVAGAGLFILSSMATATMLVSKTVSWDFSLFS
ncbi:MAG: hypothetical protein Tsb0015_14730 [Simkaniaceae bacterium]